MSGVPINPFSILLKLKYINIIISTLYQKHLIFSLNLKIKDKFNCCSFLIKKKMILFNNLIIVNINYIVLVEVV